MKRLVSLTIDVSAIVIAFAIAMLAVPAAELQAVHPVGGSSDCVQCHSAMFGNNTVGPLLNSPATTMTNFCISCHGAAGPGPEITAEHNGPRHGSATNCGECHTPHVKDALTNIKLMEPVINGITIQPFTCNNAPSCFVNPSGNNGLCQVCHTQTQDAGSNPVWRNDGTGNTHNVGTTCTNCHAHTAGFKQDCTSCHGQPPATGAHMKHAGGNPYTYTCDTCHYGNNHNTGTPDVGFDPSGITTRFGNDANTPTWNSGTKTCSNIYCHSNAITAQIGGNANFTWGGTGSGAMTYATIPAWNSGTRVTCGTLGTTNCHEGPGTINSPYLINDATNASIITSNTQYPRTGSHAPNRSAHFSADGNFTIVENWTQVQCFWCHTAESGSPKGPRYEGTYGSVKHVDGIVLFFPIWSNNTGVCNNTDTPRYATQLACETNGHTWVTYPGSMAYDLGYAFEGSQRHCGDGKTCW